MQYQPIVFANLAMSEMARQLLETIRHKNLLIDDLEALALELKRQVASDERTAALLNTMAREDYTPPKDILDGEAARKIAALARPQKDPAPAPAPVAEAAE